MSDRKLENIDPDLAVFEAAFKTFADERRWCAGGLCSQSEAGPIGCLLWHLSWAAGIQPATDAQSGEMFPDYDNGRLHDLVVALDFDDTTDAYKWNDNGVKGWMTSDKFYHCCELVPDLRRRIDDYRAGVLREAQKGVA
jgi:hypothetical protein